MSNSYSGARGGARLTNVLARPTRPAKGKSGAGPRHRERLTGGAARKNREQYPMGMFKRMKDMRDMVEAAPGMVAQAQQLGAQAQQMAAAQQAAYQAQSAQAF